MPYSESGRNKQFLEVSFEHAEPQRHHRQRIEAGNLCKLSDFLGNRKLNAYAKQPKLTLILQ
tara:strand:+ start:738 stop:923 length:186 start_codon:yes stop_codon:yes gene_type:complete